MATVTEISPVRASRPADLESLLKSTLEKALSYQRSQQLPVIYRNKLCISTNQFIHRYPDGRRFLIRQNRFSANEQMIRELR